MDPLRDSLSAQASLLVELLTAAVEPDFQAAGVSMATFDLLSAIRGAGGRATQAEVARRLGVTPPTLSESVKAAVGRGLLEQVADRDDARLKRLRLTATGERTLDAVLAGFARAEEAMLGDLDPKEVAAARQVLRQAVRNLARRLQGP
ncbi:MAG: MarR family winged helix-turn-helix transcriptional regulator [Fimbriimonas sp.]